MNVLLVRAVIGSVLLVLLILALRAIPFVFPSYLLYASAIVAIAAAGAILRPLAVLWMPGRGIACAVFVIALLVVVMCVCWPLTRVRTGAEASALDRLMPEFDVAERHEVQLGVPPQRVWQALHETTLDDVPVAIWLMRLRLAADGEFRSVEPAGTQRLLDLILSRDSGFVLLHEEPVRELVVGMAGQPWARSRPRSPASAAAFAEFAEPGAVRIVMNFAVEPAEGGSRLSTETRIVGVDRDGTRVFGRYWRLVYPGSALMRQVWLDAIAWRARGRA